MKQLPLFALPFLLASTLHTQPGQSPPPRLVLQALDTDNDGQLSAAEIEAASMSLLKLDRNHDGQITSDEYTPRLDDKAAAGDLETRLMSLDRNGDGVLTSDEVPERMRAMFARGDTNHDGKLTPDEIKAMAANQSDPRGRPVGRGNATGMLRMDPVLDALDIDHDGVLTAAEIASAPGALKTLDKNADGILSQDELKMRQGTPLERAAHLFDEWDTNKDGSLTKAELSDRMQPQFNTIDLNHDGVIDMEEATTYFATLPQAGSSNTNGRTRNPPRERMPQNDAPPANQFPPATPQR